MLRMVQGNIWLGIDVLPPGSSFTGAIAAHRTGNVSREKRTSTGDINCISVRVVYRNAALRFSWRTRILRGWVLLVFETEDILAEPIAATIWRVPEIRCGEGNAVGSARGRGGFIEGIEGSVCRDIQAI